MSHNSQVLLLCLEYCFNHLYKLDRLPVLGSSAHHIQTHSINSCCRRFDLLLFGSICSRPMIVVVTAHAGDRSTVTGVTPLFHEALACLFNRHKFARDSVFAIVFGCFLRIKKMLVRTETGTHDMMDCSRYEQFEISPETIEQELRSVDCRSSTFLRFSKVGNTSAIFLCNWRNEDITGRIDLSCLVVSKCWVNDLISSAMKYYGSDHSLLHVSVDMHGLLSDKPAAYLTKCCHIWFHISRL